jgi:hypothetical protein
LDFYPHTGFGGATLGGFHAELKIPGKFFTKNITVHMSEFHIGWFGPTVNSELAQEMYDELCEKETERYKKEREERLARTCASLKLKCGEPLEGSP